MKVVEGKSRTLFLSTNVKEEAGTRGRSVKRFYSDDFLPLQTPLGTL